MDIYEFGDLSAGTVLIQPIDENELAGIGEEFSLISDSCDRKLKLIAVKINDWNRDLSPWEAPAVFGKDDFGSEAADTLGGLLELCSDREREYYIGGYSLAGLFALWSAYQTYVFSGVAAASPSIWFPTFADYMRNNSIKCGRVYLSLGDKEEKTRNPIMATVSERIREAYGLLKDMNVDCTLEWNEGNHFKDVGIRTAKAFAWLLK